MKNKWYRSDIIERFMDKRQQEEFERQYRESKVVNMGKKVIDNKPYFTATASWIKNNHGKKQ